VTPPPEPAAGEYRCAQCGGICALVRDETWSDELAMAEKERDFPGVPMEECAVICDECYQDVRPDTHPKEYGEFKEEWAALEKARAAFEAAHPGLLDEIMKRYLYSLYSFNPGGPALDDVPIWPEARGE
jgi:hypothetical protein